MYEFRTYDDDELAEMATTRVGNQEDFKIEEDDFRVSVSGVGEGTSYEILVCGNWYEITPTIDGRWIINT